MYTNSSSRVRLGNHFSKAFSITRSVLQGDTLAPFLFIILVDYILREIDDSHGLKTHTENPEENLPDLDFADGIVLLDETDIVAAEHYDNLQNSASQVGLRINKDKTKIMHINYHREGAPPKALEGLEVVEDFKYLGTRIDSPLSDFRQRRGIAWSKFWKLQTIWTCTSLSLHLKFRLFDSLILSILLYGAAPWTLVTTIKNPLNSFGSSCYRAMLNIKRTDRIRSDRILDTCNKRNFADLLIECQLRSLAEERRLIN